MSNQRPLPSQAELRQMLDYNPRTGDLVWLRREPATFIAGEKFSKERKANIFNARFPGKPAVCFHAREKDGHVVGVTTINNSHHITTRVIWQLVHGKCCAEQIICKNGDGRDLRLSNLQPTAEIYKSKNHSMYAHNTSGHRGVGWHKRTNRWRAYIKVNQKTLHLGLYSTIERAVDARIRAEKKHGWRPYRPSPASNSHSIP